MYPPRRIVTSATILIAPQDFAHNVHMPRHHTHPPVRVIFARKAAGTSAVDKSGRNHGTPAGKPFLHNPEVARDWPRRAPRAGEKPQRRAREVELDAHIRVDQGGHGLFNQAGVVCAKPVVASSVAARHPAGHCDCAWPGGVEPHTGSVGRVR